MTDRTDTSAESLERTATALRMNGHHDKATTLRALAAERDARDAEIARLREEVADLRASVIAFGAPAMVNYARERGWPNGHLFPTHYDILERSGARMASFTRIVLAEGQRNG